MIDPAARATHARQLMEDPLLVEAFGNVRDGAIAAWTGTRADAVQEREIAWLTVKVLDRIRAELQSMVDTGAIAAARVQAPLR